MSESHPRAESSDEGTTPVIRNPIGWIVLGILLFYALSKLIGDFNAAGARSDQSRLLTRLHAGLVTRELGHRFPVGNTNRELLQIEDEVERKRKTDPQSAAIWVAVRTELHQSVAREDILLAARSKEIDIRTVGEAYLLRPASPSKASSILATLDERGQLSQLAAVHLREAAGIPGARKSIQAAANRYLLLFGVVGLVGIGCLISWLGLLLGKVSGALASPGRVVSARTDAEADRYAFRAATLFAGFQVLGILVSLIGLPAPFALFLSGGSMFIFVPVVLRRMPSFEDIVRAREGLAKKAAIGFWAFFLEIPITITAASVGQKLFENLPQNEHPAATMLMRTHDPLMIAGLFFAGAIVAPFWEEIMFRGLLFPALTKVLKNGIFAALLSSFMFATVHPQGPGGWIGLTVFALCSCVLANRTRSLVPSIVMHATHNAVLLVMAVLMQ